MSDAPPGHLRTLDEATARFASLAREATGDEPVPACEPWRVRDLVEHVGTMHRWAASIVLSGQRLAEPQPLVAGDPADWYAGTAAALLAALRAVDPGEPVPNFSRIDETAAFWPRRQLHEVTVHVVDLLQALGRDEPQWAVPAELAADGVDEVLQVFFPRMTARGSRPDVRSRVRLVADDLDRSWVVAPAEGDGPPVLLHPTAEVDAMVSGSACDLYLALWHRVPRHRLRFEGDDAVALLDGPTTP
jgi:uncharacterized protein (TIGR03083 family)